jgi:hypothetical protein
LAAFVCLLVAILPAPFSVVSGLALPGKFAV